MKKYLIELVFAIAIYLWCTALALSDEIDSLSGYYTAPSQCSMLNSDGEISSCKRPQPDCLKIKRINKMKMKVEVYSTQALGSSCAINGVAKVIDGKKLLLGLRDNNQKLIINVKDKYLEFEVMPKSSFSESCGVHASLQGLKFDRITKKLSDTVCFGG